MQQQVDHQVDLFKVFDSSQDAHLSINIHIKNTDIGQLVQKSL